ncbi:MAG: FAD-dependent oxidoreductase [Clostridia bacterium]|nr:FAD-dependent oxidoreductase [Clostridia bacterium]
MLEKKVLECDLCVVGGGIAGMCVAISAAREGVKVVLMHERPVLGGNASSEIRMWICGAKGENNRETGILEEITLENFYRNPTKSWAIWDSILYDFVRREKNITLLLNTTCMDAKVSNGQYKHGRNIKIESITGYQMTTQRMIEVVAKYFSDCSGDSILAPLTGAEFRLGRESKDEYGEDTTVEKADSMTMGMSCLVYGRETLNDVKFIAPSFATKLTEKDFEHRNPDIKTEAENFWYLELGGNRDSIGDTEELRDELVPLALGTWDYVKNSGKFNTEKWDLDFLGFLPGKRESRRMVGEYVITQRDISDGKVFEDEIAFGGWPLDDHFPGGFYHRGVPNTNFSTPAPYSLPYRALYSKNVDNLFFAGRNISMTHMAMSSIRVMATCGLLGEAVGKAVSIAVKNECTPHDVYLSHLDTLQSLLLDEDCFLPSMSRKVGNVCKKAVLLGANDIIRNGQDRAHKKYGTTEKTSKIILNKNDNISYRFDKAHIGCVHIVFDSDINRITIPGGIVERTHTTRANISLSAPVMHMPTTLCKDFTLTASLDGKTEDILCVKNNRKRCYHIPLNKEYDTLTLKLEESWGGKEIPLISFDFN